MLKRLAKLVVLLSVLRGIIAYLINIVPTASMAPTFMPQDFILVNRVAYNLKIPVLGDTITPLNTAKRGDIVIFRQDGGTDEYIKRIIAVEHDHVRYDQKSGIISVTPNYRQNNCQINHCETLLYKQQNERNYLNPETVLFSQQGEKLALIERQEFTDETNHAILLTKVRYDQSAHYFKQDNLPLGEWIVPAGHYFVMGDFRENSIDSRFFGFIPHDNLTGKAVSVIFNPKQETRFFKTIQ
ncbi:MULTISPECIES: signal peptidase I [Basfia]|nr:MULTISPECIES: signal peptidase I [Basfia]QIM69751.1 signal peptidase I [Basfia succiniciproducens]SCX80464.1 signal peptidase I [Basfia succiniciproducens]